MGGTLQDRLEKLLNAYSHLYDIERDVTVNGQYFPASATYYLRDENYLISKKHVLSAVEQHEYVYFHLTERLDARMLQAMIDITRQDGLSRVHPSKEHMFSYITTAGWSITLLSWKHLPIAFFPTQPEEEQKKFWRAIFSPIAGDGCPCTEKKERSNCNNEWSCTADHQHCHLAVRLHILWPLSL